MFIGLVLGNLMKKTLFIFYLKIMIYLCYLIVKIIFLLLQLKLRFKSGTC